MCRHACLVPGIGRDEAIDIALKMEGGNRMGIGCGWVDSNGKFQIQKYPTSLTNILKNKKVGEKFLSHLPHSGFTLLHQRLPSMGEIHSRNTHPFNINDKYLLTHNGCYGTYNTNRMLKLVLEKYQDQDFEGETDSEIAGRLMELLGFKQFLNESNNGGCFFLLHKNGTLNIVKSSGDLQISPYGLSGEAKTYLISSELDKTVYPERMDGIQGWYKFNPDGTFKSYKKREFSFSFNGATTHVSRIQEEDNDSPPMTDYSSSFGAGYYGGREDWRSGTHAAGSNLPSVYRPPEYGNPNLKELQEQTMQSEGWSSMD